MISVIVYGRNDTHGYNLHRRVALSLNCIAEVLTDPDDEILFVDWNTPRRLPPITTAISDTLTDQALARLMTIRVGEDVHSERFGNRTHLAVIEPVARNVALVRSNPANRWVLSTNTDMLFLVPGGSLSKVVAELPDGYFALPRYELPEAFWESLPRSDPRKSFGIVETWNHSTFLESIVESYEFIRYDAPGDFQLAPRSTLVSIGGFDEHMIHGWHVDSNLAKRLWLHYGETRSLLGSLKGFHTNHSRAMTIHHSQRHVSNDNNRFTFLVDKTDWRSSKQQSIGLSELSLYELKTSRDQVAPYLTPTSESPRQFVSNFNSVQSMRTISVEHSLTVLVETMSVLGNFGRLLYIGNGPIGERLKLFYESGLLEHFQWMRPGESITLDSWHSSNWIVIDFDLPEIGSHPALTRLPSTTLKAVSDLFLRMAEFLDLSRDHGPNAPHVVSVINAEANEFQQAVAIFVDAPGGQTAFRVRTGSIRQAVHPRRVNIFLRFLLATSIPLVSRHRSGPRRPYPDNVDRDTCITRVFKYVTKTIRKCLRVPWNKLGLLKRSAIKYETWIIRKSDPSTVLRLYASSLALGSRRSDEFYELRD